MIDTGGGIQALWQLDESLENTQKNREWVEGYNRTLVGYAPGGDEACWDVCHLLRLPGPTNLPNPRSAGAAAYLSPRACSMVRGAPTISSPSR